MSGKSKEEIAFELVSKLKGVGVWGENNKSAILDMYAECLEATSGLRDVEGVTSAAKIVQETIPEVAIAAAPEPVLPPQQNQQPVQQAAQYVPQQPIQQPTQQPMPQHAQMVQSHNLAQQR